MKLSQKQRENIITMLKDSELEEKESSIVAKVKRPEIIYKLMTTGYLNFKIASKFLEIIKEQKNTSIYISVLFEYDVLPVEIGGLKVENPSLELCEKLNDVFNIVMPCSNGTVIWLGLKEK